MEFSRRFLAIVATQRSGTNFLMDLLEHSSECIGAGEIFEVKRDRDDKPLTTPRIQNVELSFFRFRVQRIIEDPWLGIPTRENQRELFRGFLQNLDTHVPQGKRIVIDTKYNSLHHLNSVWKSSWERPEIIHIFREFEIPVIHLVRSNELETIISDLRADRTKQYTVRGAAPLPFKFAVEPRELLENLRLRRAELENFCRYFVGFPNHFEIRYEKLAGDPTMFDADIRPGLEQLLHVSLPEGLRASYEMRPNRLLKIIHRIEDTISNFEELQSLLKSTEFASCVSR